MDQQRSYHSTKIHPLIVNAYVSSLSTNKLVLHFALLANASFKSTIYNEICFPSVYVSIVCAYQEVDVPQNTEDCVLSVFCYHLSMVSWYEIQIVSHGEQAPFPDKLLCSPLSRIYKVVHFALFR